MAVAFITSLAFRSGVHKSSVSSPSELKALRIAIPSLGMCRRGKSITPSISMCLTTNDDVQKRIDNHDSNLWDDDFIQSLSTPYGVNIIFEFVLCI